MVRYCEISKSIHQYRASAYLLHTFRIKWHIYRWNGRGRAYMAIVLALLPISPVRIRLLTFIDWVIDVLKNATFQKMKLPHHNVVRIPVCVITAWLSGVFGCDSSGSWPAVDEVAGGNKKRGEFFRAARSATGERGCLPPPGPRGSRRMPAVSSRRCGWRKTSCASLQPPWQR